MTLPSATSSSTRSRLTPRRGRMSSPPTPTSLRCGCGLASHLAFQCAQSCRGIWFDAGQCTACIMRTQRELPASHTQQQRCSPVAAVATGGQQLRRFSIHARRMDFAPRRACSPGYPRKSAGMERGHRHDVHKRGTRPRRHQRCLRVARQRPPLHWLRFTARRRVLLPFPGACAVLVCVARLRCICTLLCIYASAQSRICVALEHRVQSHVTCTSICACRCCHTSAKTRC